MTRESLFGFEDLRPGQAEAVAAALSDRDARSMISGYRVDTNLGWIVEEGGRTGIRAIVSPDGRLITAFQYGPVPTDEVRAALSQFIAEVVRAGELAGADVRGLLDRLAQRRGDSC